MSIYTKYIKNVLPKDFQRMNRELKFFTDETYRPLRVHPATTKFLGYQYTRSLTKIEIDVTYVCNLTCYQCNRSVHQAPSTEQMTLEQIHKFVQESIENNRKWTDIRLLGGEPTLHPHILDIIDILLKYKHEHLPNLSINITTNGYGKKVNAVIEKIPAEVNIENTSKESSELIKHYAFNIAPIDNPKFKNVDYAHGCPITAKSIGLTTYGYYPCAIAASIDRVMGQNIGRKEMPKDNDELRDQLRELCQYCGRFNNDNSKIKDIMSPAWKKAYAKYKTNKPKLDRY